VVPVKVANLASTGDNLVARPSNLIGSP